MSSNIIAYMIAILLEYYVHYYDLAPSMIYEFKEKSDNMIISYLEIIVGIGLESFGIVDQTGENDNA